MPNINKQLRFILHETFGLTAILGIIAFLLIVAQKPSAHMMIIIGFRAAWIAGFIALIYQSKKIE